MQPDVLTEPVMQYGFAGFCLILLAVIVWQFRVLVRVLHENNRIIADHAAAIRANAAIVGDTMELTRNIHDKLLSRPCIAAKEPS